MARGEILVLQSSVCKQHYAVNPHIVPEAVSPALQRQTLADMGSNCKYSGRITLTLNSVWYTLYFLSVMNTTLFRIFSSGWVSLVLRGMLFF